jgi:uncharacterized membrane protein
MNILVTYIATLLPLVVLDAIWILGVAKDFYAKHIGFLFTKDFNTTPAFFFYPLYALGVMVFVVMPALSSGSWVVALWRGALLGLVAYGAYDLTNHVTIANWPLVMTVVDMAWGATVTLLTGVIAYYLITTLG